MQHEIMKFLEKRKLTRAALAHLIGVEPWTVGAWISGERKVSTKYAARIQYFLSLPEEADLVYFPAADHLAAKMRCASHRDAAEVSESLNRILESAISFLGRTTKSQRDRLDSNLANHFFSNLTLEEQSKLLAVLTENIQLGAFLKNLSPSSFVDATLGSANLSESDQFTTEFDEDGTAWIHVASKIDEHLEFRPSKIEVFLENFFVGTVEESADLRESNSYSDLLRKFRVTKETEIQIDAQANRIAREIFEKSFRRRLDEIFDGTIFRTDRSNSHWCSDQFLTVSYYTDVSSINFQESFSCIVNRYKFDQIRLQFNESRK